MLRTLPGERGMFTAAQVRGAIRGDFTHFQRSRLVSVENTTNLGGGAVPPRGRSCKQPPTGYKLL